jgi:ubiquinone/menaquinone biosynthesis C-methylase UbiE
MRTPSISEIKGFYNNFGKRQDNQSFYEDEPIQAMLDHADLRNSKSLFEFGCGTGRLAGDLLERYLPEDTQYSGVDFSETMVELATARLAPFGERAHLHLSDGRLDLQFQAGSYDKFLSTYVLEILTPEDMKVIMTSAHRMLKDRGLICLVVLANGYTPLSRFVAWLWSTIYKLRPLLVGGCRPVQILPAVDQKLWQIRYHEQFSPFGVPSEVLVAAKVAEGRAEHVSMQL